MKKYRPYVLIVIALAIPLVYQVFNYDYRGGLPGYRRDLSFVNIISFLIFIYVFMDALCSLIGELENPKKNWKSVLSSIARMAIVILLAVLSSGLNDKQRFGWNEDDLKKIINVDIGGKSFLVPVKHWVDTSWRKSGETSRLGLIAMLPNFEGRTIEMKEEFISNKNGMGRWINISLKVVNSINSDYLGKFGDLSNKALYLQYYKSQYEILEKNKLVSNSYSLNYFGERGDKELYISSKDNDLTYYSCYKDPEKGRDYTPSCETEFPLWGNVVMSYRFKKKNLKDWEEIHNGVFRFINDMEIKSEDKKYR